MSLGDFASLKEGIEVLLGHAKAEGDNVALIHVLGEFGYIAEKHDWNYEILHDKYLSANKIGWPNAN